MHEETLEMFCRIKHRNKLIQTGDKHGLVFGTCTDGNLANHSDSSTPHTVLLQKSFATLGSDRELSALLDLTSIKFSDCIARTMEAWKRCSEANVKIIPLFVVEFAVTRNASRIRQESQHIVKEYGFASVHDPSSVFENGLQSSN